MASYLIINVRFLYSSLHRVPIQRSFLYEKAFFFFIFIVIVQCVQMVFQGLDLGLHRVSIQRSFYLFSTQNSFFLLIFIYIVQCVQIVFQGLHFNKFYIQRFVPRFGINFFFIYICSSWENMCLLNHPKYAVIALLFNDNKKQG